MKHNIQLTLADQPPKRLSIPQPWNLSRARLDEVAPWRPMTIWVASRPGIVKGKGCCFISGSLTFCSLTGLLRSWSILGKLWYMMGTPYQCIAPASTLNGSSVSCALQFLRRSPSSPSKKFRSGSSFSRRAGPSGNSCVTYQPSVSGEHKAQVTTKAEVEPGVHLGRPDVLPQTPPLEKISEVSTIPDPYFSPVVGETLQTLTTSSTLLEKHEVPESEFIH